MISLNFQQNVFIVFKNTGPRFTPFHFCISVYCLNLHHLVLSRFECIYVWSSQRLITRLIHLVSLFRQIKGFFCTYFNKTVPYLMCFPETVTLWHKQPHVETEISSLSHRNGACFNEQRMGF